MTDQEMINPTHAPPPNQQSMTPPPNQPCKRFAKPKTDEDVAIAQQRSIPKNTAKTTTWCVSVWMQSCVPYPQTSTLCCRDHERMEVRRRW